MSEFRVSGWASVGVDATVEADDIESVGKEQATEALVDEIQSLSEEELKDRLLTDVEFTHTEEVRDE